MLKSHIIASKNLIDILTVAEAKAEPKKYCNRNRDNGIVIQ